MATLYHLASIYLTITCYSWNIKSLPQNSSCERRENCARNEDNPEICPPGYYCSEDGGKIHPCPEGTYSPGGELGASSHCIDCPVDFFNHIVGQKACFPCGSEAIQPKEGQVTCVCRGQGQVFQPSDSRCPCAPGHQLISDTNNCVPIVYDICRDGAVRNQEGQCLNKKEWDDYCSNQVCILPKYYQGYDKVLGLCVCQTEDLDDVCDANCRRKQKQTLQITCVDEMPKLRATNSTGEQVLLTADDDFGSLAIERSVAKVVCTSSTAKNGNSVFVVMSTEQGLWGIYDTNSQFLKNIFESQGSQPLANLSEERTSPSNLIPGILNPTTCINLNDFIMFVASKHNYPVYDVNNLYNTNPEYDWGKFRTLEEEIWLSQKPKFLFLYQFQEPGVYVIKLSSNHYKKMYIRVMLTGGQCYEEGAFFPTTPRHVIRNGIAKMSHHLLKPDWPAITGILTGLFLILITCIVLLVWFQDLGWKQKAVGFPKFRKQQLKFNFDNYSSKGSALSAVKKLHSKMRMKGQINKKWDEADKKKCYKFLEDDEFWDYEQQIDMECFNTQVFYDILLKQSLMVTARLGQLKEEAKTCYEKLVYEASSLKDIFVKCLSITWKPKHYNSSVMESYTNKKKEAELEITKRKKLAAEFEDILNRQRISLQQDIKCLEDHCVLFNGALRECLRLLKVMENKTSGRESGTKSINFQKLMSQFEDACNRMYTAVEKESDRLKAWGVLGEGTGAHLVNKDRTRALTKRDIIALDGSVRECDIVRSNSIHGLLTPDSHSVMLLSNHYLMPIPSNYFVHNETGKVLPIAGNVVYDPVTSQLITSVDSAFREIWKLEMPLFPYVPYPVCPNTGLPVYCSLPNIHHTQHEGPTIMIDPVSGLEVPVLAVTRHPQTLQWMALGGTYIHPLTNMVSPIEIGGPMIDTKTGKIFPILGVELDNNTGQVIPVGGLVSASGVISVIGDHFCEPLSGKKARIQGAVLHEGKVLPHAGGYQALLESNLLMAQINVINILKAHKDIIPEDEPLTKEDFDQAHRILIEAVESVKKSTAIRQQHLIYRLYNVSCQQRIAADFKCHGGNLGMVIYPKIELWIPAVVGMEIPDPGPSDKMVPILGVEYDFIKGHLIPLAGTMEDSDGKGLVPIKVGARTIDPITGDSRPVVGAQTCPLKGIVIPVVQPWGSSKGKDCYLLEGLEKELKTRERFWQNQKIKEEELLKELSLLITFILDVTREGQVHKFRLKDKMESLEETCQSIEASSLCETQRRTNKNLQSLSMKVNPVPFIGENTEEKEQQFLFSLVVRKTMEKLSQFTDKLEQESERLQSQLREWQKSREGASEEIVEKKQTMVIQSIVDEFEDHIMKRLLGVESAYSRLEYLREYNKLQGRQAKSLLLGTTPQYINSLGSYWNSGKEVLDLGQNLTPMLKYLIQLIEENKNGVLLSQTQIPTSGYSSRSTLKASAANSDTFQVKPTPDTENVSSQLPWFTNAEMIYGHQGYLFRFLTEKQASELVHLERLLVTEEINKIWNFFETCRLGVNGNVNENLLKLVSSCKDKAKLPVTQYDEIKELESSHGVDVYFEWYSLLDELIEVHTTALQALHHKHVDEVKSMALHPDTVIPEHYFNRDVRASIEQLAADMQTVYKHHHCDTTQAVQEMSSHDAKLYTEDIHTQTPLLRQIAAKVVKQELLTQIHVYNILDEYCKLQVDNCVEEVQEILRTLHYESCSGKEVAKEAANIMEESQVEKLLDFFRTSYKEQLQHGQWSLSEIQSQLKEEHLALTEKLLQDKDTILFEELSNSASRSHMEHVVCCVLSLRHLRQTIVLLEESFKIPKHDPQKLSCRWRESGDIITGHCQEDILSLLNNKTEARLLLMELQCVINRIQMRALYLEELAHGLKEYCSDKVHILTCVEEAHYLAHELHTFKDQKLKRLKEELRTLSEFERAEEKVASSLGKVEESVGEEKTSLRSFQEQQSELEQIHRTQISEERLKLQDQLERGELNGLFKQKLIREHEETVAFLEKTLQRNLESLNMKLEEEMKNKQNEDSRVVLENTDLKNNGQNILSLLEESVCIFQQAEQIVASRISLLGPRVFIFPPDGDAAKIESSPVLSLLKEVDSQMRANAQSAGIILGNGESAKDNTHTFRDTFDLQLTSKSELASVNEEELTAGEIVVYQYGIHIMGLLKTHLTLGELHLHIASGIPEYNYKENAFAQSFFYQKSEGKLYVSREYLKSVGSLILLIVHCLSHIACGDLSDDTSASFLRTFYEAIKICFSDGFLSRLQMLPSSQDTISDSKTEKRTDFFRNHYKLKAHKGTSVFKEPLNEMISQYKAEILLKNKLSARKKEFFNQILKESSSNAVPSIDDGIAPAHLEEIVDDLNFQLLRILEKEIEPDSSLNNEDGNCYSHMISLEKECLKKQIKSFEEMIDKQNSLI